jgi:microcompartment protein CcmL/EutN
MMILDAMEKGAGVRVLQVELNDQPGVCMKLTGTLPDAEAAANIARSVADGLSMPAIIDLIPSPGSTSAKAYAGRREFNPLIEQATVQEPNEENVAEQTEFAVGLIETQGFTAVFEAIDTAVKTAAVEVLAREKLGGGYITVVIKGDVAAVKAAVEAGKAKVEGLGRLVAAHVIPSPSKSVLSLLPGA